MAKFSKVDEYGFERPDSFNYEIYENFMSDYLGTLARRNKQWEILLKNKTEPFKRTNTLKRYVRKGIPIAARPAAWLAISGAKEQQLNYAQMKQSITKSSITEIIEIDLPRTFPDNIHFSKQAMLPREVYNILATFAEQNKDVGYCQGMNYICGLLLLATKDEETSFWLLKVLVEKILPPYYIHSMAGLLTDLDVLDELVQKREPLIHQHINKVGMPWAVATTKWFICIYAEVLPIETVLRIWDCLFYEGSKIIFRVALALIKMHTAEILAATDLADMVTCFKQMAEHSEVVHCHQFMTKIFKLQLSNAEIDKLRKKHTKIT